MSGVCLSGKAAVSILFKLDPTAPDQPFFAWQGINMTEATVDLSLLLTPDISLNSYISGYQGTDTIPPCTKFLCWYVIETPFKINQKQLDFFTKMDPSIPHNFRQAGQGKILSQTALFNARGFNIVE